MIGLQYGVSQGLGSSFIDGAFYKPIAYLYEPAFTKTGNGTAQLKAGISIEVAGRLLRFSGAQSIIMPTLAAGTDYAIFACSDGTIRSDQSFSAPSGYTTANSRQIGGFHYAPGGNATAYNTGGDTTPQINQHSFWDLKFRPQCPDPRGMTYIGGGGFWADIYFCNTNPQLNGTSRYNQGIADGLSLPIIPTIYGGNGSATYPNLNWWTASEIASAFSKRLPRYHEFQALAFGVVEASSIDPEPSVTLWDAPRTSLWGVAGASGYMHTWGADLNIRSDQSGFNWFSQTGGRGQIFQNGSNSVVGALFGGAWPNGGSAGSRCSSWSGALSNSFSSVGVRAVSDSLILV